MTTTTTTDLADFAHPAGAVHVAEWYDTQPGPYQARRYFRGSTWVVNRESDDDIAIQIDGTQGAGGDVTRQIMVIEGDYERMELSSSDHARQFGRALIAAADEWDQSAVCDLSTDEQLLDEARRRLAEKFPAADVAALEPREVVDMLRSSAD